MCADFFGGVSNPGLDFGQLTQAEADLVRDLSALGDPNDDRILGWDDTDNAYVQMLIGSGLSYDAGTNTLSTTGGSGDVSKVGTPANNQMAVWTGDGTLEGISDFTYDGTSLNLITGKNFQIAGGTVLADSAGTLTLSGIDAIDLTTEATIEAAIDTLANLVSIQGRTVTLADAGANAIFGWDDVAGAYENLTAAEALAATGITASAAEVNILDGATLSTAELNILDGATLTVTELNYVDGVTSAIQTQIDGKQASDAGLTDISGLAVTDGNIIVGDGTNWVAESGATARTSLGVGTGDSPQFTAVNLGHASDTTIARVSAGLISVEGVEVVLATRAATRTIVLTAAGGWPSTTAGCATNAKVEAATNDVNYYTLDFDQTTQEYAEWSVVMPDSYDGSTITATFYWTAASGTGDVIWAIQGLSLANDDAIDQAFGTAVTVTDTLIATGDLHVTAATSAVTIAGTPAGGDFVAFKVYRDADAGGDTLSADARLMMVKIEYGINNYTD